MTNQKEPILCSVYVQNKGWSPFVGEGEVAGTSGESLRIEGIKITGVDRYRVFMQDRGWGFWTDPGEIAGTIGQGLCIEAIEIQCCGMNYRVHAKNRFVSNPVEVANFLNGACQTEAATTHKCITNRLGK